MSDDQEAGGSLALVAGASDPERHDRAPHEVAFSGREVDERERDGARVHDAEVERRDVARRHLPPRLDHRLEDVERPVLAPDDAPRDVVGLERRDPDPVHELPRVDLDLGLLARDDRRPALRRGQHDVVSGQPEAPDVEVELADGEPVADLVPEHPVQQPGQEGEHHRRCHGDRAPRECRGEHEPRRAPAPRPRAPPPPPALVDQSRPAALEGARRRHARDRRRRARVGGPRDRVGHEPPPDATAAAHNRSIAARRSSNGPNGS